MGLLQLFVYSSYLFKQQRATLRPYISLLLAPFLDSLFRTDARVQCNALHRSLSLHCHHCRRFTHAHILTCRIGHVGACAKEVHHAHEVSTKRTCSLLVRMNGSAVACDALVLTFVEYC